MKSLQKPRRNEAQLNTSAITSSKARADGRSRPACEMYPDVSVAARLNTACVVLSLQMLGGHQAKEGSKDLLMGVLSLSPNLP